MPWVPQHTQQVESKLLSVPQCCGIMSQEHTAQAQGFRILSDFYQTVEPRVQGVSLSSIPSVPTAATSLANKSSKIPA